jgi:hypothetical protein
MQPLSPALPRVIATTAGVTFLYLLSIALRCPLEVILMLYGVTLIVTVRLVVEILKDPYSADKTFTDYFYLDREDLRRCGIKPSGQT